MKISIELSPCREAIERYVAAKLADVSGLLGPPEDISFYGEEFHELKVCRKHGS